MSESRTVQIGPNRLGGILSVPSNARGLVVFVHGRGSSRHSPRNQLAARHMEKLGFATLLFDLLTETEALDRRNVFDIPLLASRVGQALRWLDQRDGVKDLPIGLFGASTGAAAAIVMAAKAPGVRAVVSRGGRPDLAVGSLLALKAPTLLIVGERDTDVLGLNRAACQRIECECRLAIVPRAGHLFEEEGTLERALRLAGNWFLEHLAEPARVSLPFDSRTQAGEYLANELARRFFPDPVVYALPRGGVPVAIPVARVLNAPLDLLMVRKIGTPGNPELAAASVVDGEQADIVPNDTVMRASGLDRRQIVELARHELAEIERRRSLYLPGRRPMRAAGHTAILVDDGVATGTSMRAAIHAVRRRNPHAVVVAVPVGAPETIDGLSHIVDACVCLARPERFGSVGAFYRDFHQLADEEVIRLLKQPATGAVQ